VNKGERGEHQRSKNQNKTSRCPGLFFLVLCSRPAPRALSKTDDKPTPTHLVGELLGRGRVELGGEAHGGVDLRVFLAGWGEREDEKKTEDKEKTARDGGSSTALSFCFDSCHDRPLETSVQPLSPLPYLLIEAHEGTPSGVGRGRDERRRALLDGGSDRGRVGAGLGPRSGREVEAAVAQGGDEAEALEVFGHDASTRRRKRRKEGG